MNEAEIDLLADQLAAARLAGTLVEAFPSLDLATGWRVQAALAARLAPALGAQCGWKMGATSAGAMAALGVDRPIVGRLFANRVWHGRAGGPLQTAHGLEAEPEIILKLGSDLRVTAAWIGIEFNRPCLVDPFGLGAGSIVADNSASFGILCRHRLSLRRLQHPAGIVAALTIGGVEQCRGSGDAVLAGPLDALNMLKTILADNARGLRPGDLIATGAMCRSIRLLPGGLPDVVRPRRPSAAL